MSEMNFRDLSNPNYYIYFYHYLPQQDHYNQIAIHTYTQTKAL